MVTTPKKFRKKLRNEKKSPSLLQEATKAIQEISLSKKISFPPPNTKENIKALKLKYIEICSLNFLNENSKAQKRMSSRS